MPDLSGSSTVARAEIHDLPYSYRSLFPVTERYTYLNHASVAPLPAPTLDSMAQFLHGVARHGGKKFEEWEHIVHTARCSAARLLNARPEQVAFLRNTSEALSVIANGISWRPGDNIVSTAIEFPANIYPWSRIAAEHGVELRLQEAVGDHLDVEEMLSLIDDRTRVLTLSWVQFLTGQRFDLQRIGRFCRERQVLFVVDAVQGLGAFQLDVQRDCVDVVAAGAQKFLLGPKGTSLLYVSDFALRNVRPTVVGWTAVRNYRDYAIHDLDYREGALRFEGGSLNEAGICGLGRTLELLLEVGPARIEQYLLFLGSYLVSKLESRGYQVLSPRGPGEASAIIVCRHPSHSAEEIFHLLDTRNIVVSVRIDRLRVAPHFYNTLEEVDNLVSLLP